MDRQIQAHRQIGADRQIGAVPPRSRADRWLSRRGGAAEILRVPAWMFGGAVALRNQLYARGLLPHERLNVPVLSIGNLSAGGTGKTPFVAWLCRALRERGNLPGVASRGYKAARPGRANDETALLGEDALAPELAQDPRRAKAARALIARGCNVIVLDDGFQHRRLWRDLDFVLVDATRPFGLPAENRAGDPDAARDYVRALLPRGLLREPLSSLARADLVVLTRADQVSPRTLDSLLALLRPHLGAVPLARARHRPTALRSLGGAGETARELTWLERRRVGLVSGIGNPEAFQSTLEALGAQVVFHARFPDHHAYAAADARALGESCAQAQVPLICTPKDAVKLRGWREQLPAESLALEVRFDFLGGLEHVERLLAALPLRPARAGQR